jgi:hypothetical protein
MVTPGTFCYATRLLPSEIVGAVGANGKNPACMRVRGWFGTGGSQGAVRGHCGGKVGAVLYDEVDSFIHSFIHVYPLHQFPARLPGHPHLVGLATDRMVFNTPDIDESSAARHGGLTGVSGQRPEQGADAKFFATQKTWAQGPYPAQ